ncbi:MAG: hypothetical protein HY235_16830 [Acidobacteria bacterium]|nr:hypothetical protein [Acidobacteriota bacterium]
MSKLPLPHPAGEQLLRYADGELSSRESEQIRVHLSACWQCRAELEEVEQTINECVRYRKSVLANLFPPPPAPWCDIRGRLTEVDATLGSPSLLERLADSLGVLLRSPRRWAAVATTIVLIAVIVSELRHTPSVQAAELLRKAALASESHPQTPRRIQIRTSTRRITRIAGASTATAAEREIETSFRSARYDWDDPLSAKSFAAWRSQLPARRDSVVTVFDNRSPENNRYEIRTAAESGELHEAMLALRMRDLRAVEARLEFGSLGLVEISELPDEPFRAAAAPEAAAKPPAAVETARTPEKVIPAATASDELRVFAALRRLGADLGEPIEVKRTGSQILVSAVGLAPRRQQSIRQELAVLPQVQIQFADPSAGAAPPVGGRSIRSDPVQPGVLRLQEQLEKQLGGRASFDQFADQALDLSDSLMAHVHALNRLADHFTADVERQMLPPDRLLLQRLRLDHAQAISIKAQSIEARMKPVLAAVAEEPGAAASPAAFSGTWQAATQELFPQARRTERLLAVMLGGAASEVPVEALPSQLLNHLTQLRASAEAYRDFTAASPAGDDR